MYLLWRAHSETAVLRADSSGEGVHTVEDELKEKATEFDIDLASVNLVNQAEEADLFNLFEIMGDMSKKTKLRILIREQQNGELLILCVAVNCLISLS